MFRFPPETMPVATLGKSGITVTKLGFGSHLNDEMIAHPHQRERIIRAGIDNGVGLFDVYNHGQFKQFEPMGHYLEGSRKNVVISLVAMNETDKLQDEIELALDNFKTDYIDCYRLYEVDDDRTALMEKNRKAGKIRAIGMVAHNVKSLHEYLDRYGNVIDYVMLPLQFPSQQMRTPE